ncbi:hypothetical protein [Virgibacillus doumboii]|uniref:hypothetical protein n=1 Tax=Virgibacillus doumboii TaxID=2697503 RepID=UPI0013DF1395|nr:hypothetical protein [Virgibacillus doumboii]
MFEETFAAELATRTGSMVEVFTENNFIEGILSTVTANLVLVIDVNNGYENDNMYISVDAISYIRFPAMAV